MRSSHCGAVLPTSAKVESGARPRRHSCLAITLFTTLLALAATAAHLCGVAHQRARLDVVIVATESAPLRRAIEHAMASPSASEADYTWWVLSNSTRALDGLPERPNMAYRHVQLPASVPRSADDRQQARAPHAEVAEAMARLDRLLIFAPDQIDLLANANLPQLWRQQPDSATGLWCGSEGRAGPLLMHPPQWRQGRRRRQLAEVVSSQSALAAPVPPVEQQQPERRTAAPPAVAQVEGRGEGSSAAGAVSEELFGALVGLAVQKRPSAIGCPPGLAERFQMPERARSPPGSSRRLLSLAAHEAEAAEVEVEGEATVGPAEEEDVLEELEGSLETPPLFA